MESCETMEELARILCRELYEFTDGQPMEWRKAVGGAVLDLVMEHAVESGWLMVDNQDDRVCCLTDEGRRLVRKTFS
jgi:hypothetical protein